MLLLLFTHDDFNLTSPQFRVVGPTGVTGVAALCPVALEYSIDIGLVPIPRQLLVEHSVLGTIAKATSATGKIAQVKHKLCKTYLN